MADFATIPETLIKQEPLESDGERERLEEDEEEDMNPVPDLDPKEEFDPAPDLDPKEEEEEGIDDSSSDDEDDLLGGASSTNIFEPEISIESEEEDLRYGLKGNEDSDCPASPFDYDNSLEDQDYDPSDEDFVIRKTSKNNNREKKYQCPICGKFFLTSSAMNGHVAKGHGTTLGLKFTCHVCGAAGSSRASLKRHLIRTHKIKNVDHPELLTKKCTHCNIGFSSHLLLYEHIRSDHSENLSEYHNCSWCPALMRAKASLLRHIRRTHPGKEEPMTTPEKCALCEQMFPSRHLLQRHLKTDHPNQPRHVCSICNAGFKFPYMLSRHKMSHEDPQKYDESRRKKKYSVGCEFCGRKFGSKPRLEYHVEVVHTNPPVKTYTCRLCGLTFPTAKQNNRHYRKVHRPERQKIHCGKCNITFESQEECAQHRALHPNTCDICQKQFLRRDSLREHLLIHSAPRHQCPHCTKKFTQRSNLKRHIRVHTGEKPYKCPYCSRCFSDKSACNSHTRVHTGYERSVCTVCGASFSKKQRLNYHMRMHTGEGLLYCPLCVRPSTNSYSLRKHIECHQQPLTKALASLGFKPLLASDPNFVMRALQALTQATLQNISRHQNIPNSFIDDPDLLVLGGGEAPKDDSDLVEECSKTLSTIAKIEEGEGGEEEEEEEEEFSLTKFLQDLLEKESQKARSDGRCRRDRRLRTRTAITRDVTSPSSGGVVEFGEEEEEEEELPSTIGDELVKQCLEIIMKDEPHSDQEDFDGSGMECEREDNHHHHLIKTEPPEHFDSEDLPEEEIALQLSKAQKGIPKIKISRVAKTDSTEDIFVAEIVKKM